MAADLDSAAALLAKKCEDFEEQARQARTRIEALEEQLGTLREGLDEDWAPFLDAAQALLASADAATTALDQEGEAVGGAIDLLDTALREARPVAEGAVDDAESDLQGLRERASSLGTSVERALADAAEHPLESLAQQATETRAAAAQALEAGANTLREEFVTELEQDESSIELLRNASVNLTNQASTLLDQAFVDWAGKLAEASDKVHVDGFNKAVAHIALVVEHALETSQEAHRERLQKLLQALEAAHAELTTLRETVIEREGALEPAAAELVEAVVELGEALPAADAALARTSELLRQRGYMGGA